MAGSVPASVGGELVRLSSTQTLNRASACLPARPPEKRGHLVGPLAARESE